MILSALYDLPAVDEAGGEEVNSGLHPQGLILEGYFVEGGSHAVDTYIAVDSESGREDIGKIPPEFGHCGAWPGDAGEE